MVVLLAHVRREVGMPWYPITATAETVEQRLRELRAWPNTATKKNPGLRQK